MPLITDDFLIVNQADRIAMAVPSGVAPRLWPDSAEALLPGRSRELPRVHRRSAKRRLNNVPRAAEPTPIDRVFFLAPPAATPDIRSITPADAVMSLTASTFVAQVDDPRTVRTTFTRVTSLLAQVPSYRLAVPRDLSQIPPVCDAIRHEVLRART
jgi:hypothetical protein